MNDERQMTQEELAGISERTDAALRGWENIGGSSDADAWAQTAGDELLSDALALIEEVRRLRAKPVTSGGDPW